MREVIRFNIIPKSVFIKGLFSIALATSAIHSSYSQFSNKIKDGLKFYIDEKDSSKFVKLNMTNQIWMRYNENNPNTTVAGTDQKNTSDISIRRIRFVASGQMSDRVSFFVQFGQNNLNYIGTRKTGSFFHDVTADYAIIKKKLCFGAGLNGWNGPSRFSNTSVTSILVLDPPNYQEVTNDTYDQFVRRLGVYLKGKLGKLDYRVSAGKPFTIQTATSNVDPLNTNSSFSTLPPKFVYQGYVNYQFLDQEGNSGPGFTGTYLGSKKVFNIGGGFYYQKNGMYHLPYIGATSPINQDIKLFALDVFYDTPLNKEKGTAFSLYTSYSNYNFGYQFLKVSGPDNLANGTSTRTPTAFDKSNYGNAFPYLGTGSIFYAQTAYKLKDHLLGDQGTLQFFADGQLSDYSRLKDLMFVYDLGVNWLIKGHNSKFTLNYQNRPYFTENTNGDLVQNSRKSCVVLQYQLAF